MSWRDYKPKTLVSTSDLRESRRRKLEAERLEREERAQRRAEEHRLLQAAAKAQEEAEQAFKDFLAIDPDILSDNVVSAADSEIEDILSDSQVDNMTDFDKENGTDGDKAMEKLSTVVCPFNMEDLDFWFSELEGQLEMIEIKAQWTKRMALQRLLPVEVKEEVKTLLRLSKTQAGTDIYFKIKQELLDLFGKKPEDDYNRAKNRKLGSGKPSQLGKKLIDDLCHQEKKLDKCCCPKIVWAMFQEQLPITVRNHISDMTFSKDTYKAIFAKADQVWSSNQAPEPPSVSRPTVAAIKPESVPTPSAETAALGKNKKPKKPATPSPATTTTTTTKPPKPKGTRHPTAKGKDEALCRIHFSWGVNATYCAAPWKCPMKDTWKAPQ